MLLEPPLVHAPKFEQDPWIQTPSPVRIEDLHGRVTLVEFWDFTCINCVRTLPYARAWFDLYHELGLEIVGIHTPEFPFARDLRQVRAAAGRLGIRWPVLLDNDQRMWTSYANRYWPTMYLIDPLGYIRYKREGEGGYDQTERAIRSLLEEIAPRPALPPPIGNLRVEDSAGAVCAPVSPELQIDSVARLEDHGSRPSRLEEGRIYLQGEWSASRGGLTLAGPGPGDIDLPFRAAEVHAVLSSGPDETALPPEPVRAQIRLGGQALPPEHFGADVFGERGLAWLRVDSPRLYHLAAHLAPVRRTLSLHIDTPGWTLYSFSFGTCLAPTSPLPVDREEKNRC
jgi:thiol-disulfide isomerase/thioredoxin